MENSLILRDLFSSLQNQMVAELNTNRGFINHPTSKGDALENTWIEWLRRYLPNRYSVDKAIIIDSLGNLSDQIDLVIYDQQYTPFVLRQNEICYIPAEGVYAVFEVKPDLQGSIQMQGEAVSYLEYAGRKIESVRKLKRTSTNIIDRGKKFEPRPLTKIIGGILANSNQMKKIETVQAHLKSLTGLRAIDMGCAVTYGSFYIDFEGEEVSSESNFEKRINDYYLSRIIKSVEFSKPEVSLVTFFFQLMRYLQQTIGTVAAIDLNEYSKAINYSIDEKL